MQTGTTTKTALITGASSGIGRDLSHVFAREGYNLIITARREERLMEIKNELETENIESRLAWKPMHMQKVFEGADYIGTNVSETLFKHGLCLPSDTKLTDDQMNVIIQIVKSVINV